MIGIAHFDHQSLPDFPPGPLRLRAGRRHGRRPRASKSVAMCCIFSLLCFKWRPHHNPLRKTARFSALVAISNDPNDMVNRLRSAESIQARRRPRDADGPWPGNRAGNRGDDGGPWTCAPSAAAREPNGRGKGRPMCAGAGADRLGGGGAVRRARPLRDGGLSFSRLPGPPSSTGRPSACAKLRGGFNAVDARDAACREIAAPGALPGADLRRAGMRHDRQRPNVPPRVGRSNVIANAGLAYTVRRRGSHSAAWSGSRNELLNRV